MWFFVFFKQKTAYEMRISDWSSDVCSSDLPNLPHRCGGLRIGQTAAPTPGKAKLRRTQRNRARADQHDLCAPPAKPGQFAHQRSEPGLARFTLLDQQRTADLDHQPAAIAEVLKLIQPHRIRPATIRRLPLRRFPQPLPPWSDRKSTRLNSSH